jgi:hypothetical protein
MLLLMHSHTPNDVFLLASGASSPFRSFLGVPLPPTPKQPILCSAHMEYSLYLSHRRALGSRARADTSYYAACLFGGDCNISCPQNLALVTALYVESLTPADLGRDRLSSPYIVMKQESYHSTS